MWTSGADHFPGTAGAIASAIGFDALTTPSSSAEERSKEA